MTTTLVSTNVARVLDDVRPHHVVAEHDERSRTGVGVGAVGRLLDVDVRRRSEVVRGVGVTDRRDRQQSRRVEDRIAELIDRLTDDVGVVGVLADQRRSGQDLLAGLAGANGERVDLADLALQRVGDDEIGEVGVAGVGDDVGPRHLTTDRHEGPVPVSASNPLVAFSRSIAELAPK